VLFSTSDTIVIVTSVFNLKGQFFNINICCFIIAVCIMFIRITLRRPANQLWSYNYFSMCKMSPAAILHFRKLKILPLDRLSPTPTTKLNIMSLSCVAPELCHFEILDKMAAGRHRGLVQPTCRTTHDGILAVLSVLSNFILIWLSVSKILQIQFFLPLAWNCLNTPTFWFFWVLIPWTIFFSSKP